MRKTCLTKLLILGSVLWCLTVWTHSIAQEADYDLAHEDIFGRLRRPHVGFSHEIHAAKLEDAGCGICHHVQDDKTGRLVYEAGEELSCKECHGRQKEDRKPALREAFHGSCTKCHRQFIKNNKPQTGPTTCGGCHIKR